MTELEQEWLLFRRAELNEQLEKWIDIKTKLDERKKSNDTITYKNWYYHKNVNCEFENSIKIMLLNNYVSILCGTLFCLYWCIVPPVISVLHHSFWLSNLGFSLNIMENKTFLHFQNYVQMLHNINILVAGNISDYEIFSVTTKMSIIFSCWRISIDLIWPKQKCSC